MQTKKQVEIESQMLGTLKTLAQSYEQISVMRMQRVRGSVLSTRDFLNGIAEIFKDVKDSYHSEMEALANKKSGHGKYAEIQKNGKEVSILLSANNKLYGDILARVYSLFISNIQKNNNDIVIIGKIGKSLYETSGIKKPYTYFDLPDQEAKIDDISPIIKHVIQYEKIYVYYGRFLNVISQEPSISEISGDTLENNQTITKDKPTDQKRVMYYFEPSLKTILSFFEDQVFTAILKQVVDESELSRLASRIKSMEDSLSSIQKEEILLKKSYNRTKRLLENNRQIQRIAGINLWFNRS